MVGQIHIRAERPREQACEHETQKRVLGGHRALWRLGLPAAVNLNGKRATGHLCDRHKGDRRMYFDAHDKVVGSIDIKLGFARSHKVY